MVKTRQEIQYKYDHSDKGIARHKRYEALRGARHRARTALRKQLVLQGLPSNYITIP